MARRTLDPTLYLVTDREMAGSRSLADVAKDALAGGATAVQFREKKLGTREMVAVAQTLRRVTSDVGAALIVNDRIDVALAVDADGVHVGQTDMPVTLARQLIGPDRILGVTACGPEEALMAKSAGADYVGCSATFGLDGLRDLAAAAGLPLVAIGGVNAENARAVMATGVAGVAVVSAIVGAADPRQAAQELRRALEAG